MLDSILPLLTAIDVPDISPDFSAPFMTPLLRIIRWVLAGGAGTPAETSRLHGLGRAIGGAQIAWAPAESPPPP